MPIGADAREPEPAAVRLGGPAHLHVSAGDPGGAAFEGEASMLIVPGAAGEIGVLARHAPLVAMLKAGTTRVHVGRDARCTSSRPARGSSRSSRTARSRSSTTPSSAKEIDPERAQRQLEEAQAELEPVERGESDADRWQLEQRIRHAENQLSVSGR